MAERPAPTTAAGGLPPALARALAAAHETGRRAHPAVNLPFEAFADRAGRRPGPPQDAAVALGRAAQGDLYLAIACETGATGAWESFCGTYRGRLEGLLLARGVTRADAESMAADLLADLALPPPRPGPRTLLGTYDGSGSLFAWLAVILARRRVAAAARRPVALTAVLLREPRANASRAAAPATDPLDALLDDEAAERVRAAFAQVWARLSDRERLLLVLKHRHGAKQTEIAALLGVGSPRVSRVLDRAVRKIRLGLRRLSGPGERFGGRDPLWATMRDAVAEHLARIDVARIEERTAPPTRPEARETAE